MNISRAGKVTGLSPRMIRFYEAEGILQTTKRATSGYREFEPDDIATLRFIRNARDVGFELMEIRQLLEHWRKGTGAAPDIQTIVATRLAKIRSAESRLRASRLLLESIVQCPTWRLQPECELLEYLAEQSSPLVRFEPQPDRGNASTG